MTYKSTEQERSAFLPCPFCGGRSEFNEHDELCYFTKLAELKAKPASADLTPMLELLEAWNRRTPASQAQRKPLSDSRIFDLQEKYVGVICPQYPLDSSDWLCFARAIEAAHGITPEKQG